MVDDAPDLPFDASRQSADGHVARPRDVAASNAAAPDGDVVLQRELERPASKDLHLAWIAVQLALGEHDQRVATSEVLL